MGRGDSAVTTVRGRWREYFPLPFVAITVLLLVLIALTPNLLSLGTPAAGTLETQANLIVDGLPGENATHYYVQGIGLVRYASISLALARPPPGGAPSAPDFAFPNATVFNETIEAAVTAGWDPVALNVTAVYIDPTGVTVDYLGTFEVNVTAGLLVVTSYLPAPASTSSTPLSDLPITFPLELVAPPGGSR